MFRIQTYCSLMKTCFWISVMAYLANSTRTTSWLGRPTRDYYVAAVDVMWDYAPSGYNLVDNDYKIFNDKLVRNVTRVGRRYQKAIFKQFTDATYSVEIPSKSWRGIVGPTISGEVGDVVIVHFKNMATGSRFGVHPHGFRYRKDAEGALYLDGTRGADKLDDSVPPGGEYTYTWFIDGDFVPTADDDNCVAWGYHSHTNSPKDVDSGLVGFLLTCRQGILRADGSRRDVDRELALYADIAQESNSLYIRKNILACGDPQSCFENLDRLTFSNPFKLSSDMYHINGYMYGNGPDFDVCEGERVVIYFMSLDLGSHPIHINGQTMIIKKQRTDTVFLAPGVFSAGLFMPVNPGRWLIYCRHQEHYARGMMAFLSVHRCSGDSGHSLPPPNDLPTPFVSGNIRRYFIAAEEILWDYAPIASGQYATEREFLKRSATRIGSVYKKAVFREYYDQSFVTRKQRGPNEAHYALAGPPIKTEVGDIVEVVFMNKASRSYSILFNGVVIDKANEGNYYKNFRTVNRLSGAVVAPGDVRVYRFHVPDSVSPTDLDPSCITYIYHSAYGEALKDIYSGLFGPLLVCKRGVLSKRKMLGVREFFVNWQVINENESWYIDENIKMFANLSMVNKTERAFQFSNQMRAINGRSFGNLEGMRMCVGEKVVWHMYGLGSTSDLHHFSFESNNFQADGRNLDTATVVSGIGKTVTMTPDQIGTHFLRTGQLGYEREGMFAYYEVGSCQNVAVIGKKSLVPTFHGLFNKSPVVTRRYFIAAIEVEWEYVPNKINPTDGSSLLNPKSPGFKFLRSDVGFIGSIYRKAIYREFTDETFKVERKRGHREIHLGMQGPMIRGSVGDKIEILFANMASFPFNLVPRNVITSDGSSISSLPATKPGATRIYRYMIPKRSGPGPREPNCVATLYSSRVNPFNDTYSGLFGTFVICRKGVLDMYGRRTDNIDREFSTIWAILDENGSNYHRTNVAIRAPSRRNDLRNESFVASNQYNMVNGLLYNNVQGLDMFVGERVAWYVIGLGSIFDYHTIHWHGQLFLRRAKLALKNDVITVFAGTYETVEMINTNSGSWLLHCHVGLHTRDGMKAVYNVFPKNKIG